MFNIKHIKCVIFSYLLENWQSIHISFLGHDIELT